MQPVVKSVRGTVCGGNNNAVHPIVSNVSNCNSVPQANQSLRRVEPKRVVQASEHSTVNIPNRIDQLVGGEF